MESVLLGLALVAAGLGAGLTEAHLARLKAWDRPRWALGRARRLLPLGRFAALALGVAVLAAASPWAAVAVAAALAAGWGWMRWVRSERYVARRLRREVADLRSRHPGVEDRELLGRVVLARHPEWGPELVEQMVRENPGPAELARMIVRMERGWSQTA